MSTLQHWLRWWYAAILLVDDPRFVGQTVNDAPIDGPTEVNVCGIANETVGGTKCDLYKDLKQLIYNNNFFLIYRKS